MDLSVYNDQLNDQELIPKNKFFRILFDSTVKRLKIIARKYDDFEDLRNAFSTENPGQFFSKQYGYKTAAKIFAINKFGYFSSGLLFEIMDWIKNNYGDLSIVEMSTKCKKYILDFLVPLKQKLNNINDFQIFNVSDDLKKNSQLVIEGKNEYKFRDYQENAIRNLFIQGYGRGLIELPTGSGKSFVIANFIWNVHKHIDENYKYLILVPQTQLVEQFYKDLKDYGYDEKDILKFTGSTSKKSLNKEAKIIIANRQFLFKNIDKLPKIDVLICDEVHQATAESTLELIDNLDCKMKIGCSGTLPRDKYKKWLLLGVFSRIVYKENIVSLQDQGYISNLKITLLNIKDETIENDKNLLFNLHTKNKFKQDEFGYSDIAFNEAYNAEHEYFAKYYSELYKPVLEYIKNNEGNTLILFDKLDIGKNIYQLFQELYPEKSSFYNDGSTDMKVRESTRQYLEQNKNNFLFANVQIMSTGINIKRLNSVVFCFNSKSTSRIIQSIGRILRLHKEKEYAELIDIVFNTKYSVKHFNERRQLYKQFYNKSKPDKIVKLTT